MDTYIVTWTLEVDAESPREAAEIAEETMTDPDCSLFVVKASNGETTFVNLEEDTNE